MAEKNLSEHEKKQLERAKRVIRGLQERTEDRGFSEAEALESARKIGELLQLYDLELSEVMLREQSTMVEASVFAADRAAQSIVTGIGKLCSLVTYCKGGQTVTTYVLYGHAHDVELAKYLYEVCAEALDHDWVADMNRNGYSQKRRENFRMGFAHRVFDRLVDMRAERDEEARRRAKVSNCTDLVVLKDQLVTMEFEKTGVKLVSRRVHVSDRSAYERGRAAGGRVNLNSPLENARAGERSLR